MDVAENNYDGCETIAADLPPEKPLSFAVCEKTMNGLASPNASASLIKNAA
jgi:hypothetical protein